MPQANQKHSINWRDFASKLQHSHVAAAMDVKHLLAHVLGCTVADVRLKTALSSVQYAQFNHSFSRLSQGEPLAYILGEWEFWGMKMHLNSHVLIPRADTECLVQAVLDAYPSSRNARVVDCGTGSGAIALALAHERANWDILGVDQSEQSVLCARDNQRRLGISQTKVSFSTLSWNALPTTSLRYDIVVANPPYIDQNDPDIHPHVHLYEPHSALFSTQNGMADLHAVIDVARQVLLPHGSVFLEHGYTQAPAVTSYLSRCGFRDIQTLQDLSGLPRVTMARN